MVFSSSEPPNNDHVASEPSELAHRDDETSDALARRPAGTMESSLAAFAATAGLLAVAWWTDYAPWALAVGFAFLVPTLLWNLVTTRRSIRERMASEARLLRAGESTEVSLRDADAHDGVERRAERRREGWAIGIGLALAGSATIAVPGALLGRMDLVGIGAIVALLLLGAAWYLTSE